MSAASARLFRSLTVFGRIERLNDPLFPDPARPMAHFLPEVWPTYGEFLEFLHSAAALCEQKKGGEQGGTVMKRRMTREEYEALLQKCCKRGLISSSSSDLQGEHVGHHISLGVTAALEELVEVEEPNKIKCEKCGEAWVRVPRMAPASDGMKEGDRCRYCQHVLGTPAPAEYRRASAGWATLGVPSSTEPNLKAYLIELDARVRKLEGR